MTILADKDCFRKNQCPTCKQNINFTFSHEEINDNMYPYIAYCKNCNESIAFYLSGDELPFSKDEKKKEQLKKLKNILIQSKLISFSIAIFGPSFEIDEDDSERFDPKREYKWERAKICHKLIEQNYNVVVGEDLVKDPEFEEIILESLSVHLNPFVLEEIVPHIVDYIVVLPCSFGSVTELDIDFPKNCIVYIFREMGHEKGLLHKRIDYLNESKTNIKVFNYQKPELEICSVTGQVLTLLQNQRLNKYRETYMRS